MKQVLQSLRTGELTLAEVPEPACLPRHVLVRNAFSFVSPGTERSARETAKSSLLAKARQRPDQVRKVLEKVRSEGLLSTIQKVRARLEEPVPMGYSSAGVVIEIGEGVEGIYPGTRVACAGAGYANHAEVVCVPKNLVAVVPEGVALEDASSATLCTIAMQGVRVSEVALGENVGVIGLGLLGQLTVQLLKASGCNVLGIDLDPAMVQKATEIGAGQAVLRSGPVEEMVLAMTSGQGLDAVILTAATTSNDPVELAGRIARKRGRIVAVGLFPIEIPRRIYYPKELQLRLSTSYGPGRYDPEYEERGHDYPYAYVRFSEQRNLVSSLELMAQKRLRITPLISHRFPVTEALEAYALLEGKRTERPLGILLDYGFDESGGLSGIRSKDTVKATAPAKQVSHGEVGLGVIGAGQFATGVLLPRIAKIDGVRLIRLATARGSSAEATARRYHISRFSCRVEDVLEDSEVNAVLIATRHHLHASQTIAALRAGKDVFVEKPLALNIEELQEVRDTVAATGRTLMVGFNRRFAPLSMQLLQWFQPREWPLHLLARINAGRLPQGSWITDPHEGGGRIIGEVCHFIDLFQYWTGAELAGVHADSIHPEGVFPPAQENISATFTFTDGSLATLVYLAEGAESLPKERYEVHGGGKSAVLDDFRQLDLYQGSRRSTVHSRAQDKGHTAELEHFFACMREGLQPSLDFDSCAATTEATFRMVDSLRRDPPTPTLPRKGGG